MIKGLDTVKIMCSVQGDEVFAGMWVQWLGTYLQCSSVSSGCISRPLPRPPLTNQIKHVKAQQQPSCIRETEGWKKLIYRRILTIDYCTQGLQLISGLSRGATCWCGLLNPHFSRWSLLQSSRLHNCFWSLRWQHMLPASSDQITWTPFTNVIFVYFTFITDSLIKRHIWMLSKKYSFTPFMATIPERYSYILSCMAVCMYEGFQFQFIYWLHSQGFIPFCCRLFYRHTLTKCNCAHQVWLPWWNRIWAAVYWHSQLCMTIMKE